MLSSPFTKIPYTQSLNPQINILLIPLLFLISFHKDTLFYADFHPNRVHCDTTALIISTKNSIYFDAEVGSLFPSLKKERVNFLFKDLHTHYGRQQFNS